MNITVTTATETVYLVTVGLQTHRLTPEAARALRDKLNALPLGPAPSTLDELKKQYEKLARRDPPPPLFPSGGQPVFSPPQPMPDGWSFNSPIICNTPAKGSLLTDPGFASGMPGQPGGPGKEFN